MLRTVYCAIAIAAAGCAGFGGAMPAAAGDAPYPNKPIRLIVPAAPGTGSDFFGRTVGHALSEAYRQQVIADNRAGAGGLIGAGLIATATPDGYTIGMASTSLVVSPLLQAKPAYKSIESFTPIALLASIPSVVVVPPKIAARTVRELIDMAKARPGEFNFASVGTGTAAHLSGEIFNHAAGIRSVHVPFKSIADGFSELFAGRVHYAVFVSPAVVGLIRDGRLRALAVTSTKRSPALPDVPTIAEGGLPTAEVDTLFGIAGPAGLPKPVVAKLSQDIVTILRRAETRERFAIQGAEPAVDTTPESYAKMLRAEHERYRKLIGDIGLKPQ